MLAGALCAVSLVCGAVSIGVFAGSVVGSDDWKGDLKSARRDCEGLGKVVEELEAKGGGQYMYGGVFVR